MSRATDEFDEFYVARMPPLAHALYLAFGDLTRAEDCAQEAFVRAWQRWGSLRSDDPVGWVRTVAWRLCVDDWRASMRVRRALHLLRPQSDGVPAADVSNSLNMVAPLSPALRVVAVLHYVQDLSVAEISELLDIPQGTVKSRLSRARQSLRNNYSTHGGQINGT